MENALSRNAEESLKLTQIKLETMLLAETEIELINLKLGPLSS